MRRFPTRTPVCLAVLAALVTLPSLAAEPEKKDAGDEFDVERIEVVGRQINTLSSVMAERREKAVVADLMDAEQISRSGDSDAAEALRRITGLTLVQDKFIYVRGLGERYSSTTLNGALVPSPDPTRSVIPVDMFPSSIIDSLEVQKAYSPDKPAAFGGGNVDIRTLSFPLEFTLAAKVGIGTTSKNHKDGLDYNGGGRDFLGSDDGKRALPKAVSDAANQYGSIDVVNIAKGLGGLTAGNLAKAETINRELGTSFNRRMDLDKSSVDPDYDFSVAMGNRFEIGSESVLGFMVGVAHDTEAKNFNERERYYSRSADGSLSPLEKFDDILGTTYTEKNSGVASVGFELDPYNKVKLTSTYLKDTSDEAKRKTGDTVETINEANANYSINNIRYEERSMVANQVQGEHMWEWLFGLGVKWQYTDARARRFAPGELEYRYYNQYDADGQLQSASLRRSDSAATYQFGDMKDETKNGSIDFKLPFEVGDSSFDLLAGYNYFERERDSTTSRYKFDTRGFTTAELTDRFENIFSDANILDASKGFNISDVATRADDYKSAQQLDMGYVGFDWRYGFDWRFAGGVRYEDFRQASVPFNPSTGEIEGDPAEMVRAEDDFYPSLSATYFLTEDMQLRFGVGQTVVRPDLREVTPVLYVDPVTDFKVRGYSGLESTDMTNFDLRWEWYLEDGANLSVGAFYKDLKKPIETLELQGSDGDRLISFRNAEDGEVYGLEIEGLRDFSFLGDSGDSPWNGLFVAGNLTVSDSEININQLAETNLTNLKRRMTGHSKYVANLQLGFDSPDGLHSANLSYNVFGERVAFAGTNGRDDALEQPFHSVNFTYSYYPTTELSVKLTLKNLLDEKTTIEQQGQIVQEKEEGVSYGLSLSYRY